MLTKTVNTAEQMMDFGRQVAEITAPPFCIHLVGRIGAGKTTFARGFIWALGFSGPVKSPTFTLVETYSNANVNVNHLDLFRIESAEELEYIGFDDYLDDKSVLLIEWPDPFLGALPDPNLTIRIDVLGHSRKILMVDRNESVKRSVYASRVEND